MGKIFYIMGKSATGKDTLYAELLSRKDLGLRPFIIYTTRPMRAKETDGKEYYFVTVDTLDQMRKARKVIELRTYDTVQGPWHYFTADSDAVDLAQFSYLALGTLESYEKIRDYYGAERVVPLYIEVEDRLRLERAMKREGKQTVPDYSEMCRRYLADQKDFSEENIAHAKITKRFRNDDDRKICMDEVAEYIRERL